jgi:AcrR family transcriptional regulator
LHFYVNGVNMKSVKTALRPNRGYHHGDLRNALTERALELVAERGPEGFSLREAARDLGVSPAAAYRHFADKAALLAALAAEGHARLASSMERAVARLPGPAGSKRHAAAVLDAIGESYVDFAVRHPSHFRVMFGPCIQTKGFAPGCAPSGRDAFQILVDALDGLVAAGAIGAAERAGAEIAAWSSVHGLAGLIVEGALPLSPRERTGAARSLARTLLLGLGCEPDVVPPPAGAVEADPRAAARPPARARRKA